jgi:hypothetical protein
MKKIGIIGTRRRNSGEAFKKIKEVFLEIYEEGDQIISGGCPKGGDRCAETLAKDFGVPILIFFPNWKKFGRGAGLVRNAAIADSSDILIACVSKDRTGGTEDTIKKFIKTLTKVDFTQDEAIKRVLRIVE